MVTDFVGRETELSDLAKLLATARLVTVTGTGGVGKTTLSLRAAADAVDGYTDGVWIVELSGLRDPALLPNTVASRLGLPEQDDRPPWRPCSTTCAAGACSSYSTPAST